MEHVIREIKRVETPVNVSSLRVTQSALYSAGLVWLVKQEGSPSCVGPSLPRPMQSHTSGKYDSLQSSAEVNCKVNAMIIFFLDRRFLI